jgi:dihydroorotate dehydrogenase (fumarate)
MAISRAAWSATWSICASSRTRLEIPVVASLNGVSLSGWVELGKELQQAGADALELNVYHVAADPHFSGDAVEARYVSLLPSCAAW